MNQKPEMATLVEQVIEAIEKGIRQGRYTPGERLVERDLAAELGVSRIPVREAIRRLAALHILEIKPYRGASVCKLSRTEVMNVIDILNALGLYAVPRAAEQIGKGNNRKRLRRLVESRNWKKTRKNKVKDWVDLNFPFFQVVAGICGNPLVPDLLNQYQLQMYRLVWDVKMNEEQALFALAAYKSLAQAILAGDPGKALEKYDKLHQHVLATIDTMPDTAFADE